MKFVCVTNGDEHAQLAMAGVLGINAELNRKAGGDTTGQPGATCSHLAGIMSGQNSKLKGAEETSYRHKLLQTLISGKNTETATSEAPEPTTTENNNFDFSKRG